MEEAEAVEFSPSYRILEATDESDDEASLSPNRMILADQHTSPSSHNNINTNNINTNPIKSSHPNQFQRFRPPNPFGSGSSNHSTNNNDEIQNHQHQRVSNHNQSNELEQHHNHNSKGHHSNPTVQHNNEDNENDRNDEGYGDDEDEDQFFEYSKQKPGEGSSSYKHDRDEFYSQNYNMSFSNSPNPQFVYPAVTNTTTTHHHHLNLHQQKQQQQAHNQSVQSNSPSTASHYPQQKQLQQQASQSIGLHQIQQKQLQQQSQHSSKGNEVPTFNVRLEQVGASQYESKTTSKNLMHSFNNSQSESEPNLATNLITVNSNARLTKTSASEDDYGERKLLVQPQRIDPNQLLQTQQQLWQQKQQQHLLNNLHQQSNQQNTSSQIKTKQFSNSKQSLSPNPRLNNSSNTSMKSDIPASQQSSSAAAIAAVMNISSNANSKQHHPMSSIRSAGALSTSLAGTSSKLPIRESLDWQLHEVMAELRATQRQLDDVEKSLRIETLNYEESKRQVQILRASLSQKLEEPSLRQLLGEVSAKARLNKVDLYTFLISEFSKFKTGPTAASENENQLRQKIADLERELSNAKTINAERAKKSESLQQFNESMNAELKNAIYALQLADEEKARELAEQKRAILDQNSHEKDQLLDYLSDYKKQIDLLQDETQSLRQQIDQKTLVYSQTHAAAYNSRSNNSNNNDNNNNNSSSHFDIEEATRGANQMNKLDSHKEQEDDSDQQQHQQHENDLNLDHLNHQQHSHQDNREIESSFQERSIVHQRLDKNSAAQHHLYDDEASLILTGTSSKRQPQKQQQSSHQPRQRDSDPLSSDTQTQNLQQTIDELTMQLQIEKDSHTAQIKELFDEITRYREELDQFHQMQTQRARNTENEYALAHQKQGEGENSDDHHNDDNHNRIKTQSQSQQLHECRIINEELSDEIKNLNSIIDQFRANLDEKVEIEDQLLDKIQSLQEELLNIHGKGREQQGNEEDLEAAAANEEEHVGKIVNLETTIENMQSDLNERDAHIDNISAVYLNKIDDLKRQIEDLVSEKEVILEENEYCKKEVQTLRARDEINTARINDKQEVKQLQGIIADKQLGFDRVSVELTHSKTANQYMELFVFDGHSKELIQAYVQILAEILQVDTLRRESDHKIDSLEFQQTHDEYADDLTKIRDELQNLTHAQQQLEEDEKKLLAKKIALERDIKLASTSQAGMFDQVSQLHSQITTMNSRFEKLAKETALKEATAKSVQSAYNDLLKEYGRVLRSSIVRPVPLASNQHIRVLIEEENRQLQIQQLNKQQYSNPSSKNDEFDDLNQWSDDLN